MIQCLALVGRVAPVTVANWIEIDRTTAPQPAKIRYSIPTRRTPLKYLGESLAADQAHEIVKAYLKCDRGTQQRLRIPLQRLYNAKLDESPSERARDTVTALEVLLRADAGFLAAIKSRGIPLITSSEDETHHFQNVLEKVYKIRSISVHAGRLAHDVSTAS
jgi:hypothetical protein